ncbi:MAG: NAD(P)/FAD-dependent oxidoreductase [Oscillospiraceae bacterium]|nr:NAD(P)/FAD-dependent oxidoreductase [Oscillospiraceae bacterium]
MIYDVAVIGGGIIGASVAYALSRYDVSVVLLEKECDVALGATRANSGIVHAGYDPPEGSLMARLNVEGNARMPALCRDLDALFEPCGSLVIASGPEEDAIVRELFERGKRNGVPDLELIGRDRILSMEPNLTDTVTSALWAPTAGIVNPWDLCIAMCEVFVRLGGTIRLNAEVTATAWDGEAWNLTSPSDTVSARYVVNTAGLYSDEVHAQVSPADFTIHPARGQYFLLDKTQGSQVRSVIFSCPAKDTKGVLIARTVHGNLLVGPTKEPLDDKDDTATTAAGLQEIREKALGMVPSINFRENIANFSGLRANPDQDDFIIRQVAGINHYFEASGIKSPGLASAPAIGPYMVGLLSEDGLSLTEKKIVSADPSALTRRVVRFNRMSDTERAALVAKDPRYGRVVCRCETVTEGEVLDAIHSSLPARTLDAIKRRTAAGLGRCQGGFCGPRIAALLAEELRILPTDILKDRTGSYIFTGPTKDAASFDNPTKKAPPFDNPTKDASTSEQSHIPGASPSAGKEAYDAR